MPALAVQIRRFVDDSQPGWVECVLADAHGHEHLFVEKVPVVSAARLDANTRYPQPGLIACTLVGQRTGDDGRELLTVDTQAPWGIESTQGRSQFEVLPRQLAP